MTLSSIGGGGGGVEWLPQRLLSLIVEYNLSELTFFFQSFVDGYRTMPRKEILTSLLTM